MSLRLFVVGRSRSGPKLPFPEASRAVSPFQTSVFTLDPAQSQFNPITISHTIQEPLSYNPPIHIYVPLL